MFEFFFFLPLLLVFAIFAIYGERKISALIQDRIGPAETGKYGLLQTVADLLKLLQKEDIVSQDADKKLFLSAPYMIFMAVMAGFAVIPLSPGHIGAPIASGLFYLLAIISLDVLGILLAGWGSNNKYSVIGSFRAVSQIISYEIPLGLSVLAVAVLHQSLDLQEISFAQGLFSEAARPFLGSDALGRSVAGMGGFLAWNVFQYPFLFVSLIVFYVAALAECNRAPFDIPEGESELIGGYHTEYSGFRWAFFMLSEYGMMLLVSFLCAALFLGSWNTPFPNIGPVKLADWTSGQAGTWSSYVWGVFWILLKALFLVLTQMWVRWTYPRLRVDQLMTLCWKYLTPVSLLLLLLAAVFALI